MRISQFGNDEECRLHNLAVDDLDSWLETRYAELVEANGMEPQPALSLLLSVVANEAVNVASNMAALMDAPFSEPELEAMHAEICKLVSAWQHKIYNRINGTLN